MNVKGRARNVKKSVETIESYEKMIHLKNLEKIIGEEGVKIMGYCEKVDPRKLKKYEKKKTKLFEQYGYGLSRKKDELITKQLIRDPNCCYEEMFNNVMGRYNLYIERSYFDNNVHRLLEKEVQYQQLRYLEKVFKWAD
jgi:hypothetical protein